MEIEQTPRCLLRSVVSVIFLSFCCVEGRAQATGSISGTIADTTGAVVAGAKITAIKTDTNATSSTVSAGSGTYTLTNLRVGTYDITVESPSFQTSKVKGVTLDVSQHRDLDFTLSLQGATQTVDVTSASPLINTSDASIAGLVTEEQVQKLPLNGRSIQNLVMLANGMAQTSGGMGWFSPEWISNGNRGETAVATMDGADATNAEMGVVQFWNFNLDAIAEFKVLQSNYSAEFGQGGGSVTQMVTKSGTNRFHGSAFEYIRNTVFDAANYFSTSGPAPFQRNEYGATFGGPIFKNRTFFFGEWAGYRQKYGTTTVMQVPTADERAGIFTYNGHTYQAPLNAVGKDVLSRYPLPNQPDGVYGARTYNKLVKQPTNVDQYSIRIDHKISEKDSFFGRATYINNTADLTDTVAALEDPSFSSSNFNKPRNFALSETHIFSPRLVNNAIFTVNRQVEGSQPKSQTYTQTTTLDGTLSNWGPDTFVTKYVNTYYIFFDKVNFSAGRHALAMGFDYRYGQDNGYGVTSAGPNGVYGFNSGSTLPYAIPSTDGSAALAAGSGSPSGLVSIMTGIPQQYQRSTTIPGFATADGSQPHWGLRVWHMASYIQDDFKMTPKLTLNLGLRYEYNSVPYEVQNRLGAVVDDPSDKLYGRFVLNPSPIYAPQRANFAPRLGVAYRAFEKTVVRGGLATFTNTIPMVYPDQSAVNFPLSSYSLMQNPTYSLTPLAVSLPTLTDTSGNAVPGTGGPKSIAANTPVNLEPIAAVTGSIIGNWPSRTMKNGYTVSGNLTIEQELSGGIALQMSYLTNHGIKLYQQSFPNAYTGAQTENTPFTTFTPGLGEVVIIQNQGISHYNALQIGARKTSPYRGLQFQANYTWAKAMTDADAVWSVTGTNGGVSRNNPNCISCEYSRASYDLRHRFIANFNYSIPGSWGFVPGTISKGWQLLGIYSVQSGFPFTIVSPYGTYAYGYDSFDGVGARPFYKAQALRSSTPISSRGGRQFFSDDAIDNQGNYWDMPTTTSNQGLGTVLTTPGDLKRNTYQGFGFWNFDVSLIKDTHVAESLTAQFRAEFFNVLNHPTFALPGNTLGASNFGLSTSTASQGAERQMQFAVRLMF